jgi:hypothetical protein
MPDADEGGKQHNGDDRRAEAEGGSHRPLPERRKTRSLTTTS